MLRQLMTPRLFAARPALARPFSTTQIARNASWRRPNELNDYEKQISQMLTDEFKPVSLDVRDISGGCGSMFAIQIVSDQFKGIPMVKQHRLVNALLADEIKQWHGLQLVTKAA
ncbi:Altered inheritance of mitochondria protein 1 [Yarrowia sp. B02]|nr:Altered inheritance of mitochondria protein 1 [Yarrowia sp. B02]